MDRTRNTDFSDLRGSRGMVSGESPERVHETPRHPRNTPERVICVCGGRTYGNAARIRLVLEDYAPEPGESVTLIHGDARGADRLAAREAAELGFWVEAWPADWEMHGKAAGPIRNREMLDHDKPDLVIAFGGGRGTDDCVREAKRRGISVVEIDR